MATTSARDDERGPGVGDYIAPVLVLLGILAIAAGVFVYVKSRQTTLEDEAADVAAVIAGHEPEAREPNTVALVGGIAGGVVCFLGAAVAASSARRHRELVAALERRDGQGDGED